MLEIGSVIAGKYKILNVIGRGGMSIVYLAMNEKVNKPWAVKEVIKNDDYDYKLELQEIEMMKKLKHPHLPSIVDVIEKDDSLLIVMDYIEGQTLETIFEEIGAQSQEIVLDWGKQLCDVLDYLHTRKPAVIYRDIKPGNVILKPDGNLVLIDFGAAREYKPEKIKDTISLGTRGYAAPEQYWEEGQSDERTDVYCLGVMLFQFLTGEMPQEILLEKERQKEPVTGLDVIISKCIRLKKEERYQSAKELSYALEHYWEYDRAYRKEKKKQLIIFLVPAIITILFAFTTICFACLESSARNQTYEAYLLKAKNAGNKEEEIQAYKNAINLEPFREDGYLQLLQECFLSDEILQTEESEQLRLILYEYGNEKETNLDSFQKNDKGYALFAYEAGVAYFYKFEEKSNKKSAKVYFEIASESKYLQSSQRERSKRLFVISDYYYKIGLEDEAGDATITYQDYWNDMVNLIEGNLVEVDNERTALVVYEDFLGQIISRANDFRESGVSGKEMKEQLRNISKHLNSDFNNYSEDLKQLKRYLKSAEKIVESVYGQEEKR